MPYELGWAIIRPDDGSTIYEWWGDDAENRMEAEKYRKGNGIGFRTRKTQRYIEGILPERLVHGMWPISVRETPWGGIEFSSESETREEIVADSKTVAKQEGSDLGKALANVIGISANGDVESLFALGQVFAKMGGYTDMDRGNAFVLGFVAGFQQTAPSGPKSLEGPNS